MQIYMGNFVRGYYKYNSEYIVRLWKQFLSGLSNTLHKCFGFVFGKKYFCSWQKIIGSMALKNKKKP